MKKFLSSLIILVLCLSVLAPMSVSAAALKLNKTTLTIYEGETYQLKVIGATKAIKWTTSKMSVATVSSKGKVKAIAAGSAVITATTGGKKFECKVSVELDKTISVTVTNMLYTDELSTFLSSADILNSKVNEDYTTTYEIKKSTQSKILEFIRKQFTRDAKLPSYFYSCGMNDNLTEFTLLTDKNGYEKADNDPTIFGLLIISTGYQQFAGIKDKDIKFSVKLIDNDTKKVFASFNESDLKQ